MEEKYTFNDAYDNAKISAAEDVAEAIKEAIDIYKYCYNDTGAITGETSEQSILEIAKMLITSQNFWLKHNQQYINAEDE